MGSFPVWTSLIKTMEVQEAPLTSHERLEHVQRWWKTWSHTRAPTQVRTLLNLSSCTWNKPWQIYYKQYTNPQDATSFQGSFHRKRTMKYTGGFSLEHHIQSKKFKRLKMIYKNIQSYKTDRIHWLFQCFQCYQSVKKLKAKSVLIKTTDTTDL